MKDCIALVASLICALVTIFVLLIAFVKSTLPSIPIPDDFNMPKAVKIDWEILPEDGDFLLFKKSGWPKGPRQVFRGQINFEVKKTKDGDREISPERLQEFLRYKEVEVISLKKDHKRWFKAFEESGR